MAHPPNINADTITQAVISRHVLARDARLREVTTSLVQHLHAFAREVRLTEGELQAGLRFLAEAGQMSRGDPDSHREGRHELALLSDTLGLSMLVAALNERQPRGLAEAPLPSPARGLTEATFRPALPGGPVPLREAGAWLAPAGSGHVLYVRGHVRSLGGAPIPGAWVEVSQGFGSGTVAARFACDAQGLYHFRTALAEPQQLPHDGPVGRLLAALGREAWRPAHLHFQVEAPGHRALATQVFRDGSEHLDSDAAFAVRRSLVAPWTEHAPGRAPDGSTTAEPFFTLDFDFVLPPHEARQSFPQPRAA